MLLFKRFFQADILSGRKTQTRRFHKNIRKVGSIQECRSEFVGPCFCKVLITRVFSQRLCDISEVDARKEGFADKAEFLQFCNQDFKRLGSSGVVTVYEFEVCT